MTIPLFILIAFNLYTLGSIAKEDGKPRTGNTNFSGSLKACLIFWLLFWWHHSLIAP